MLLEKERQSLEALGKEQYIKELEDRVVAGKNSEKLSINPYWKTLKEELLENIKYTEEHKNSYYDSILSKAITTDKKLEAIDLIRQWNYSIESVKYLVNLPIQKINDGEQAEKDLELLRRIK